MKPMMATELVLDALMMAARRRRPKRPVIMHSDRDGRFDSDDFTRWCQDNQLIFSMSRRGNCYAIAVAEYSFYSHPLIRITLCRYLPTNQI
jgi:putative transposase